MTVAFDLDGTISRHPQKLLVLALALVAANHRVFVLTAAAGELPLPARPAEVRRRLDAFGWKGFEIICTETALKPAMCQQLSVDILLDDTPFVLKKTLQLIPA